MKIGYICNQKVCVSGASNGIRMQALIWRDALIEYGHEVVLINTWDHYDWKTFDVIHCFGYADSISFIDELKKRGCKIVVSPIIDTIQNKFLYKLSTMLGSKTFRLTSPGFNLRSFRKSIDLVLVRSNFEAGYAIDGFGFDSSKVRIIPLSYRNEIKEESVCSKESFCLHVSSITQPRKNVMRLVKAAEKYKFRLVLAGSTGSPATYKPFKEIIDANDNIDSLGFVSDEQLEDLYNRASVFALPSINEGVGLVALEAAMHGCDVVVTNIGGPKEYYSDLAYTVDPFSIDDIGEKILKALEKSKQPMLSSHIKKNYNIDCCVDKLIIEYQNLLNK